MITEPVQLALVVGVPTFAAPIIILVVTRLLDRGDKKRAQDREDAVKRQVEEAARLLRIATEAQAKHALEIRTEVRAVHTLVNSDKTQGMEVNLAAIEGQLAALLRLERLGLSIVPPISATTDELATIEMLRGKTAQLRAAIATRAEQAKQLEAEKNEATRTIQHETVVERLVQLEQGKQ